MVYGFQGRGKKKQGSCRLCEKTQMCATTFLIEMLDSAHLELPVVGSFR